MKEPAARYKDMLESLAKTDSELAAARTSLAEAEHKDRESIKAAVRAGKPEPSTLSAVAKREAVQTAELRVGALEDLVDEAARDLTRAIRQHREEWVELLRVEQDSVELAMRTHFDALETLFESYWRARGATSYAKSAPDGPRAPKAPRHYVAFGFGAYRRDVSVADVFATLRALLEPSREPEPELVKVEAANG